MQLTVNQLVVGSIPAFGAKQSRDSSVGRAVHIVLYECVGGSIPPQGAIICWGLVKWYNRGF